MSLAVPTRRGIAKIARLPSNLSDLTMRAGTPRHTASSRISKGSHRPCLRRSRVKEFASKMRGWVMATLVET